MSYHKIVDPCSHVILVSYPSISSRRCTNLEQSSAAYHICSVTSRLLLLPEDIRHTSSNFVTRNNLCRARKVTLSFMDTLIAYLLTYLWPQLEEHHNEEQTSTNKWQPEWACTSTISHSNFHVAPGGTAHPSSPYQTCLQSTGWHATRQYYRYDTV